MNKIQPKPSLTFFDFVTNSKYQLFNFSITVKVFHNKFNEYKIWIEKQKPLTQRSLLEKELVNFDNSLNYATENKSVKIGNRKFFTKVEEKGYQKREIRSRQKIFVGIKLNEDWETKQKDLD